MAKPMTPAQLLATLKAEGLDVKEYEGWERRCRCCPDSGPHKPNGPWNMAGRGWGDVNGILTHITAGNLGKRTVEQYIRDIINGDPNVPCKAQFVVEANGTVWLNSAGRCNHAGKVGKNVRTHMRAADFSLSDDFDNRYTGAAVDGNAFTYGIENIGVGTITEAQRTASVKINAAIARHYGWTGQESVGHGEVSSARGKADPNLDMGKFRRDVMARVKSGTKPDPIPEPELVTVTTAVQNVAGYNAPGRPGVTRFKTYIPRIAKAVIAAKADTFCVQELSNKSKPKQRPLMDSSLKGHMTRAPGGTDGRYVYTAPTVTRIGSGNFVAAKSTWYKNDDKQAGWVAYTKDGARAMDVSFHLESDSGAVADAKRVAQATSILQQTIAKAKALNVPLENVLLTGDTNSEGMVAAAMKAAGWPAIANTKPTFRGWDRRSSKRFDYGFVRAGVKASVKVVQSNDSDHDRLIITRQLVK